MGRVKKVPVVMQMEAMECGAASLCMVLAYWGKWLPLEQLREDCGVSKDGSNALNLLKAARKYGLEANGYRVELEALKTIECPAIIHWNFSHFVVFDGFRNGKAYLNDPARGRVSVDMEEFNHAFTGVVLQMHPGPDFHPGGAPSSILSFVRNRLKSAREALVFTLLIGILTSFVSIVAPLFSQIFMDDLLTGRNPDWFEPFLALMFALILFQFTVRALQGFKWVIYHAQLSIEANASFMWHVLHLPLNFFQQRYVGDLVMRQMSNQSIASNLVHVIAPALVDCCLLVIYLVVMLKYNVLLSLIGIASALLNIICVKFIANKRMNMGRVAERNMGKLDSVTMNSIEGIETIKAAGAELGFFQLWSGHFASMLNSVVRLNKASLYLGYIPTFLSGITSSITLALGAYLIIKGELTIGMFVAFQGYMSGFMGPMTSLSNTGAALIETRTQMERVEDVYRYKRDVEDINFDEKIEGTGKLRGKLELKDIAFGYAKLNKPLIENLSLTLEPGKSVAFVGASGCGKSTIAKLISGLYEPWSGEILFDGLPRKAINRSVFVNSVAMVNQEITMFNDTIANNVRLWDQSIEDFAVVMACRDAQIYREIVMRPNGFNDELTEGGSNLSGGQRQRLEIAAALAKEPVILILDEATSALDASTEEKVMKAIRDAGITLIVIAHRLSTIRDCDEIIVLDEGHVIERGTHESLMARRQQYFELMNSSN